MAHKGLFPASPRLAQPGQPQSSLGMVAVAVHLSYGREEQAGPLAYARARPALPSPGKGHSIGTALAMETSSSHRCACGWAMAPC